MYQIDLRLPTDWVTEWQTKQILFPFVSAVITATATTSPFISSVTSHRDVQSEAADATVPHLPRTTLRAVPLATWRYCMNATLINKTEEVRHDG